MRRVALVLTATLLLAGCVDARTVRTPVTVASTPSTVLPRVPAAPPAPRTAAPRTAAPHRPAATRAAAPKPYVPPPPTPRLDRFVAAVRSEMPDFAMDRRDEEVEEIGQRACTALHAGVKPTTVAGRLRALGVDGPAARSLVTLAKDTACHG
ncbi:hypothetical protein ACWKSP_30890 [Micromonosporaceae bacterium Da 78-11]